MQNESFSREFLIPGIPALIPNSHFMACFLFSTLAAPSGNSRASGVGAGGGKDAEDYPLHTCGKVKELGSGSLDMSKPSAFLAVAKAATVASKKPRIQGFDN